MPMRRKFMLEIGFPKYKWCAMNFSFACILYRSGRIHFKTYLCSTTKKLLQFKYTNPNYLKSNACQHVSL